jgi:NAD(P)-dependent dehydrogenase (short-subunit alcohol dehydrogenase family)
MPIAEVSDRSLQELVSLKGRRAVVTGGAQGLGRAIACRLAEAGASTMIGDIDEVAAKNTAGDIASLYGVASVPAHLDVADRVSISTAADTAVAELGGIDIWVNNAGVYPSTPALELSADNWDHVIRINLSGTFVSCQEAARRMVRTGTGGVIVNVASVAGIRGRGAGMSHYVASKHGVVGITQQLALELAKENIRVLAVAPTAIVTPGLEARLGPDLESSLSFPLGRTGRPDDVARVVLFCASDLSLFMTGSTLLVDAGEMAK